MSKPTRRPTSAIDAAEALFQPKKKTVAPAVERPKVPHARELVSLKIDSDVLAHFQAEGAGWQDRINDALREAMQSRT
ncbi:MAG: BrnA antitoxin family protein [Rhizobium sp.]|jgi:uncharacterized protein (DUF4415 family)|nr:BrnA antitoxin family protein [Rhizobium sp.]